MSEEDRALVREVARDIGATLNAIGRALDALAVAGVRLADAIQNDEDCERGETLVLATGRIAHQIRNLGNADAGTQMGGLEALGAVLKHGLSELAGSIEQGLARDD